MKSEYVHEEVVGEHWYPFSGYNEGEPPTTTRTWDRSFSNDLIISEPHHASLLGKVMEDLGGPFHVVKRSYQEYNSLGKASLLDFSKEAGAPTGSGWRGHYRYPQVAYTPGWNNSTFPDPAISSASQLDRYGTEAVSIVAPTKAEFDFSTAVGEAMSDGLPSLTGLRDLKSRASTAQRAGSAYLNKEFGWVPLVNDIQGMCRAIANAESIWEKYAADSGRLLKRKFSWPDENSSDETTSFDQIAAPLLEDGFYAGSGFTGTLKVTRTRHVKRWFEGTFMYHIPDRGDDIGRFKSAARKILGIDLTPEVLWNLAPWSWAADWQGNVGDCLANSANLGTDKLVMPWAYVMETTTESHEFQLTNMRYTSYPGPATLRQTFTTVVKLRQKATPYGFGFDLTQLTPRQIAILVALGLSKGR